MLVLVSSWWAGPWWLWWLLFFGCCVAVAVAPKGVGTAAALSALRESGAGTSALPGVAAAAMATTAAAVAASWALKRRAATAAPAHLQPAHLQPGVAASRSSKSGRSKAAKGVPVSSVHGQILPEVVDVEAAAEGLELAYDSDNEWEGEEEGEAAQSDDDGEADSAACPPCGGAGSSSAGKLWTKALFPAGVEEANNWRMENLQAAQSWSCPCTDRVNCIGADRLDVLQLYSYRQSFRQSACAGGGLRDATSDELRGHYDESSGKFTRSFVVGPLGDCCAESAGLAKGLSFATFANARSDVRKTRPRRASRHAVRRRAESAQRGHIRAWIRAQRANMEGPKGGSDPLDKWRTGYIPKAKRYEMYCESQRRSSLPILCSAALLYAMHSTAAWRCACVCVCMCACVHVHVHAHAHAHVRVRRDRLG